MDWVATSLAMFVLSVKDESPETCDETLQLFDIIQLLRDLHNFHALLTYVGGAKTTQLKSIKSDMHRVNNENRLAFRKLVK